MPPPVQCLVALRSVLTEKYTFHDMNDSRSMIVVCIISLPGKTPQVTAFLPLSVTLLIHFPCDQFRINLNIFDNDAVKIPHYYMQRNVPSRCPGP